VAPYERIKAMGPGNPNPSPKKRKERFLRMAEAETKSIDQASVEMLKKAANEGVNTAFDRAETLKPCPIGSVGSCCKHCGMGPCRVPLPKGKEETPEDKLKRRGVCGATAETIAARNFIRMVAGGAAAHSDHGRGVAELFLAVAKGEAPGYEIKDEQKLLQVALDWGIEIGDRSNNEIAVDVGERALAEYGRQEGELMFLKMAPLKRQEIWRQQGVAPRGIDREIVEIMHRTHIGVEPGL
jgi:carbon-monoxide dehydrogenase catalytic subunit